MLRPLMVLVGLRSIDRFVGDMQIRVTTIGV